MEGPLLAYKALLVVVVMMWIYRRFERVGPRDVELERACRRGRLLAVLRVARGDAARAASILLARLPPDRTVLFGMGRRPWPWYAVRLCVTIEGACVVIRAERATGLRTAGREPAPALDAITATLAELGATRDAEDGAEVFLDPTLFVDLDGDARPRGGWRLAVGEAPTPHDEAPAWWTAHSAATAMPEGRVTRAMAST